MDVSPCGQRGPQRSIWGNKIIRCDMEYTREIFGCLVRVWKIDEPHPYPWRFSVDYAGIVYEFRGIPNYCETRRSASMRARCRAKWLSDGTFLTQYNGSISEIRKPPQQLG